MSSSRVPSGAAVAAPVSVPSSDWFGVTFGGRGWQALLAVCLLALLPLFVSLGGSAATSGVAWIDQNSSLHWLLAAASAGAFCLLLAVLFPQARSGGFALVGAATAMVGVALLLGFQAAAQYTASVPVNYDRVQMLWVPLVWLVRQIGTAYIAITTDQINYLGFGSTLIAFLFSAGLCEETVKALPFLTKIGTDEPDRSYSVQRLFVWGFASGLGFGLAEAIHYSVHVYNGYAPFASYVIRFCSVVTLHAVWAGISALNFYAVQDDFWEAEAYYFSWLWNLLRVIGVPMVLHTLYDAFISRGAGWAALAMAVLSVAVLGVRIFLTQQQFAVSASAPADPTAALPRRSRRKPARKKKAEE